AHNAPAAGVSAQPLPFFTTGFLDHPTLFHYVQAGAMRLFGETETGLRLLSVSFGALCIPLMYAIGRVGWGRLAGLTAGWLMLVSHLHLHYSRIALNNIESVWFTILFVLLLMLTYELAPTQAVNHPLATEPDQAPSPNTLDQRPLLWVMLAGLTLGLGQYFYYGSRLMPVIGALLVVLLWWKKRINATQVVFLIITVFVACAPLAAHYSKNMPALLNRMRGVNVFNAAGMAHTLGAAAVWPQDLPHLFWVQLLRNLNFYVQTGDVSAFYLGDLPAFDPLTVLFFWLGLGVVLTNARRFHETALLLWFGLGVLLAGILTNDAPNGPRLIVVVSVVFLIAGVFLQKTANQFAQLWPKWSKYLTVVLCTAIAFITLQLNYTTYFVRYAHQAPLLMPITMAHEMDTNRQAYTAYLLGAPNFFVEHGVIRFVARAADVYNLYQIDELAQLTLNTTSSKGLSFFVLPNRAAELAQIAARFPNGRQTERFDPLGRLLYTVYYAPAPCTEAQPGCTTKRVDQPPSAGNLSPLRLPNN
ncbi:MAG: glycosyltransferase family 39 protein, partial [Chloroflexota bacterium]|nr:glycosyltransferase family 39 protein [Chloroflexota bacterium]